mmetsp:Transcript_9400/g.24631  ORF Transcript_9400/g.24631 Transcript_9400/m.24631 type:complete len:203 (+) Transcript_9400:23-631(+)
MEKKALIFEFQLKCYPVSFIQKSELEKGDKIILPPSILENLSTLDVEWPLMFELKNKFSGRISHCGVMEFIADEGCAYIPYWMMQNLATCEGEKINFRYKHLEKGTFVKIQPQTFDFLDISNTKAVLESKLRNFTCLTKSDTIAIEYNEIIYWLNVIEVKPGNAISIVETDVNVDFIAPNYSQNLEKQHFQSGIDQDGDSSV